MALDAHPGARRVTARQGEVSVGDVPGGPCQRVDVLQEGPQQQGVSCREEHGERQRAQSLADATQARGIATRVVVHRGTHLIRQAGVRVRPGHGLADLGGEVPFA